jgi:hypothetical protein
MPVRAVRSRIHSLPIFWLLIISVAQVPLVSRAAHATIVRALGFEDQCRGADRIFVATVRSIESRRVARAPRYFETIVGLVVDEVVAGTVPGVLELRFTGGTIGNERQSIDGMPEFTIGERYVVMVDAEHDPPLLSPIVGFDQGLYRVVTEPSGSRAVVRDHAGRPLVERGAGGSGSPPSDSGAVTSAGTLLGADPDLRAFIAAIRAARAR